MRKGIIYVYFNRAKYEKEGIEKYYVGQTIGTMEQRAGKNGRNYGCTDPNCNSKFARSIRKWGWNAFEGRVLEEVYEEDLDELEKFYIEQFDSFKNGYNSTLGGEGTTGHNPFDNKTEEEITEYIYKLSKSKKEYWKNLSDDEKEKWSELQKEIWNNKTEEEKYNHGKKIKEAWNSKTEEEMKEYSKKCSKDRKNRFEDPKERKKISLANKKRYKNPKEREKTSIAIKKRYEDPEIRKKCSRPGEKNGRVKSVYCKELNIVFSYIGLATEYCKNVLNSKIGIISLACDGKRNFTGKLADGTKLTWKWKEDVDQGTLDKAEYIDSKKYEELLSQNVNDCK